MTRLPRQDGRVSEPLPAWPLLSSRRLRRVEPGDAANRRQVRAVHFRGRRPSEWPYSRRLLNSFVRLKGVFFLGLAYWTFTDPAPRSWPGRGGSPAAPADKGPPRMPPDVEAVVRAKFM